MSVCFSASNDAIVIATLVLFGMTIIWLIAFSGVRRQIREAKKTREQFDWDGRP